jgi:MFS family permease
MVEISKTEGVLVDRADRRRLLWLANGMRIAAVLSLSTAVATHVVRLPMLYGDAVVLGVAEVIALTSAAAMIPDAVSPPGRERANTWVTGARRSATSSPARSWAASSSRRAHRSRSTPRRAAT